MRAVAADERWWADDGDEPSNCWTLGLSAHYRWWWRAGGRAAAAAMVIGGGDCGRQRKCWQRRAWWRRWICRNSACRNNACIPSRFGVNSLRLLSPTAQSPRFGLQMYMPHPGHQSMTTPLRPPVYDSPFTSLQLTLTTLPPPCPTDPSSRP